MGKKRGKKDHRSETLPPSPSHSFTSSSSSDFEFSIAISPRKSSSTLCPAYELFYKGHLLPLDVYPRLSAVRTLLSSSTTSSEATSTTASRDSSGSSNDSHSFASDVIFLPGCEPSRPSSVTEDDKFRRLDDLTRSQIKKKKYFSLSRLSSVFRNESKNRESESLSASHVKRISSTAKEAIRKYFKKVKPLYEKLSQKKNHQKHQPKKMRHNPTSSLQTERSAKDDDSLCKSEGRETGASLASDSFAENLRYERRRSAVASCPSSIMSSPSHPTLLYYRPRLPITGAGSRIRGRNIDYTVSPSSMEESQSAITHCKNSMIQSSVQGIG